MGSLQKMLIQTFGSRGDIQPFLALALGLQADGVDVKVLTNSNHGALLEEFGVAFAPIAPDCEQVIRESELIRKAMAEGDFKTFLKALSKIDEEQYAGVVEAWVKAYNEFAPDLVLSGSLADYLGAYTKFVLKVPTMIVRLQACDPNPPKMGWGLPNLPCGLNRILVKKLLHMQYEVESKKELKARPVLGAKVIDPAVVTEKIFASEVLSPAIPTLVAQSPIFRDILCPNLPPTMKYVGGFVLECDAQEAHARTTAGKNFGSAEDMDRMEAFMRAGAKPIFMGWGSMTCKTPEHMVMLVVEAARHAGVRAIVQAGWAKLSADALRGATGDAELVKYAEDNLLFVGEAPHEWLFPRVACTVHHGGAGTFLAALRSGVPTVVTPVFVDQYDHAHLVNRLGAGVGLKQFQKVKPRVLGNAIRRCTTDAGIMARAKSVSEELHAENGVQRAVAEVRAFWKEYVESGKYKPMVEEQLKSGGAQSKTAANAKTDA